MNGQTFSLTQFLSDNLIPNLKITGRIGRHSNTLFISYTLVGPFAEFVIPPHSKMPGRWNSLWEETCLEFFLSVSNADQYWEFNLSPTGHWNVYRFSAYRQGMQEEPAFASLPFIVQRHSDSLHISMELVLDSIVTPEQPLKAGISAVIKSIDGRITYWALTHSGPEADFHLRDSFIIDL